MLIRCRRCGAAVGHDASICPRCGTMAPNANRGRTALRWALGFMLASFLLLAVLVMLG